MVRRRLTAQRCEREVAQSFPRLDHRAETQHAGGAGWVGDDMAHIAAAVLAGNNRRHRGISRFAQLRRDLHDGNRLSGADIRGGEPAAVNGHRRHVGRRDVVDVYEVPHLAAVFENLWPFTVFECRAEDRGDPGIRRVARHVGAVDVVIAQRGHRPARRLRPGQRVMLLRGLAGGVQAARPQRPRSLYAASKTAQEHYALAWSESTGGSVAALRYHNVYGPDMPRDTPYSGVAAIFRSALENGERPKVFEDGGQMRDFVHVDDVAAANVAAVAVDRGGFTAANVCSGQPISIMEVATQLCEARDSTVSPVVTGQYRSGDVRHIVADPARAAGVLGFRAVVKPWEGLRDFAFAPLRG